MPASTHEDFTRKSAVHGSSDRSFGIVFAVFFAILAFWLRLHGRPLRFWVLGVSCILFAAAWLFPALLHYPNLWWMRLGLCIGRITNPVITAILFFALFVPVAIVLRILKRDPLRLKPQPGANSYWLPRNPPGPAAGTMQNQF